MLVIFIAIDPVELQTLREFGSEADFVPPQREELHQLKVPSSPCRHAEPFPTALAGWLIKPTADAFCLVQQAASPVLLL
jgi:hypothetical protein